MTTLATQQQYENAVALYDSQGVTAVLEYAKRIGLNVYKTCVDCEIETPSCEDGCCFVCGSTQI